MAVIDNLNIVIIIGGTILNGVTEQNVFGVRVGTPAGGLTLSQAGTVVRAYMRTMYNLILPDISDQVIFSDLTVYNKTQGTLVGSFAWDTSGGWVGGATSDPLPQGVCALVTLPTNVSRRRGRKFFGGYTEGNNSSAGTWSAGAITRLANLGAYLLGNQIISAVPGTTMQYGVVSEGLLGAFSFTVPTTGTPSAVPAYQRRRRPGVGI